MKALIKSFDYSLKKKINQSQACLHKAENLQKLAPILQNSETPTDFKECRLTVTICKNILTSALEIFILPNLIPLPNNYKAITWDKDTFLGTILTYFDNHVQLQISLPA